MGEWKLKGTDLVYQFTWRIFTEHLLSANDEPNRHGPALMKLLVVVEDSYDSYIETCK